MGVQILVSALRNLKQKITIDWLGGLRSFLFLALWIVFYESLTITVANLSFNVPFSVSVLESIFSFLFLTVFYLATGSKLWAIGVHSYSLFVARAISIIKYKVLGQHAVVQDISQLKELFLILQWKYLALIGIVALLLFGALYAGHRKNFKRAIKVYTASALSLLFIVLFSREKVVKFIDSQVGYAVFNPSLNVNSSGLLTILFRDTLFFAFYDKPKPSKSQLKKAIDFIESDLYRSKPGELKEHSQKSRPDIYIILVESLWDASSRENTLVDDIFHPDFRKIYSDNGSRSSVVRFVGGGTAKSEFELLCGIPHETREIAFKELSNSELNCLPRVLKSLGYETNAFHANSKFYWNRDLAYPALGFDRYFYSKDFKKGIRNGYFLDDQSFFSQVFSKVRKIKKETDKPQFNFLLTISTHFDYPLNEDHRPIVYNNHIENKIFRQYVNSVRYSTKHIAEAINELRAESPESIILVTGDHSPQLGVAPSHQKRDIRTKRAKQSDKEGYFSNFFDNAKLTLLHIGDRIKFSIRDEEVIKDKVKYFSGINARGGLSYLSQMSAEDRASHLKVPLLYLGPNERSSKVMALAELPSWILSDLGESDLRVLPNIYKPETDYIHSPIFDYFLKRDGNGFINCWTDMAFEEICILSDLYRWAGQTIFTDEVIGNQYNREILAE